MRVVRLEGRGTLPSSERVCPQSPTRVYCFTHLGILATAQTSSPWLTPQLLFARLQLSWQTWLHTGCRPGQTFPSFLPRRFPPGGPSSTNPSCHNTNMIQPGSPITSDDQLDDRSSLVRTRITSSSPSFLSSSLWECCAPVIRSASDRSSPDQSRTTGFSSLAPSVMMSGQFPQPQRTGARR